METLAEKPPVEAPRQRRVIAFTVSALENDATPENMVDWLAGFGVLGPVGYDTSADLILAALPPEGPEADGARGLLAKLLGETFRWLADRHDAKPPPGYKSIVLWEACVLAGELAQPDRLAEPLLHFFTAARRHGRAGYTETVRRELGKALGQNQPPNLPSAEWQPRQGDWEDVWLGFLTKADVPIECMPDDAIWYLLIATFGAPLAEPMRESVPVIRRESEKTCDQSRTQSRCRFLNAVKTTANQAMRNAV